MIDREYKLPDLPLLDNTVSLLAQQLFKGDLGVVLPLRDALLDQGRDGDARRLNQFVAMSFCSVVPGPPFNYIYTYSVDYWESFCGQVVHLLLWDLFDQSALLSKWEEGLKRAVPTPSIDLLSGWYNTYPRSNLTRVEAAGNIEVGDLVTIDDRGRVVAVSEPTDAELEEIDSEVEDED